MGRAPLPPAMLDVSITLVPIFPIARAHILAFPISTAWATASELVISGCLACWEWRIWAFVGYDSFDVV